MCVCVSVRVTSVMGPRIPRNVSCNRKWGERVLVHSLNGVWLGINPCACVCACMPAGCFYSAQVVTLLFPPVCLLFHPYSTILVFVPDKKRPHSKAPYLSTASLLIFFQSSPSDTQSPPLSSEILSLSQIQMRCTCMTKIKHRIAKARLQCKYIKSQCKKRNKCTISTL